MKDFTKFGVVLAAAIFSLSAGTAMSQSLFGKPDPSYEARVRFSPSQRGEPLLSGGEVSVSGQRFKPDQKVTVLYGQTPVTEPFVADEEGKFKGSFKLPADAVTGLHPLVVMTEPPYNAEVVELKISPKIPLSGEDKFKVASQQLKPGLYQSVYGAAAGALFVTATNGRPPEMKSTLIKVDPESLKVVAQITPAQAPAKNGKPGGEFAVYGIDADDEAGTVWVTNTRQDTVAIYKQSDLSLVKQFEPGIVAHARDIRIDSKAGKAYAAPFSTPEVVIFDTKEMAVAKRIKIDSEARGKLFQPIGLALDTAGGKLFVTSLGTNEVAIIDTRTEEVVKVLPIAGVKDALGVAYDSTEKLIFVTGQSTDNLAIIDEESGKVVHDVAVGAGALSVTFEPQSRLAYVSSRDAGTVTVVDTKGNIVANLDQAPFPNQVVADGRGNVYSVNKAAGPDDKNSDRIAVIQPVK